MTELTCDKSERERLLDDAREAVCARDGEYGAPEDCFKAIAQLWGTYLRAANSKYVEVRARDVAAMMVLLKVARGARDGHRDNWVDIAGYAACGTELDS